MSGRRRKPDAFDAERALAWGRSCEWPGCAGRGAHRAPRSRQDLRNFRWYCLDHVRLFNAAWNYYSGMTEAEVEADLRRDTVWNRPTWPLGVNGRPISPEWNPMDPLGIFGPGAGEPPPPPRRKTPEERAMQTLSLEPPLTLARVRARYKELVKRHHPDANGGDKAAEERFKEIQNAYQTIMESLSP